jgi:predicted dinucleotide-binding enzyme
MNITIIGTGNMAKGIATRAVAGGHSVNLHAKDLSKGTNLAAEIQVSSLKGATVEANAIGSDVDAVVVLAVPYTEVAAIVAQYGDKLDGKVVVDITNPVDFNTFQLIPAAGMSGAGEVAKLLPNSNVVKAFKTTFAGTLATGAVDSQPLDVFVAGDDQVAKDIVSEIVKDGGMRPVDVGPLANSRHLEGLGLIHMAVQDQIAGGWMSTIKILS